MENPSEKNSYNFTKVIARRIVNCYNINVKIKETKDVLQINKIAESVDFLYITGFDFINRLYKHRTIFPYAFLTNSKMYV